MPGSGAVKTPGVGAAPVVTGPADSGGVGNLGLIIVGGAAVLVVLAIISYAMPLIRGREANPMRAQRAEMWSFWIMSIGMAVMVLALSGAGILQVWLQRASDTPVPFMVAQEKIALFYWMREWAGVVFLIGLIMYLSLIHI